MNKRKRLGYPVYGQVNPDKRITPKYVNLHWDDAVAVSGYALQTDWIWNLAPSLQGYQYVTVLSLNYDPAAFTAAPTMINLRVSEFGSRDFQTTTPNPAVMPTWSIPITTLYSSASSRDAVFAEIDGANPISSLTVTLANEAYLRPTVAGGPPSLDLDLQLVFWNAGDF